MLAALEELLTGASADTVVKANAEAQVGNAVSADLLTPWNTLKAASPHTIWGSSTADPPTSVGRRSPPARTSGRSSRDFANSRAARSDASRAGRGERTAPSPDPDRDRLRRCTSGGDRGAEPTQRGGRWSQPPRRRGSRGPPRVTRLLLDEMFPRHAAALLREQHGHEAVRVTDVGLGLTADGDIATFARADRWAVVAENVADFAREADVVLVFVLKRSLPAGASQSAALNASRSLGPGASRPTWARTGPREDRRSPVSPRCWLTTWLTHDSRIDGFGRYGHADAVLRSPRVFASRTPSPVASPRRCWTGCSCEPARSSR